MSVKEEEGNGQQPRPRPTRDGEGRRMRADAVRNVAALLETAKAVFAASGVDAPMRQIAEEAGVGVGTIYRHFPQRSDLIAAVFRHEVDACADAARSLAAELEPAHALTAWLDRFVDFIVTKRGLAAALYSGGPAFEALPGYFEKHLKPALQGLLAAAADAGEICADIEPFELLRAVANLCTLDQGGNAVHARRLVAVLVDGLRYRARFVKAENLGR